MMLSRTLLISLPTPTCYCLFHFISINFRSSISIRERQPDLFNEYLLQYIIRLLIPGYFLRVIIPLVHFTNFTVKFNHSWCWPIHTRPLEACFAYSVFSFCCPNVYLLEPVGFRSNRHHLLFHIHSRRIRTEYIFIFK